MDVQEYLSQKGYDYDIVKRPAGMTAVMNCPKCGDREKKFGISLENGAFSCKHENNCGWTGGWKAFQEFHSDQPKRLVTDREFTSKVKEYEAPRNNPGDPDEKVYDFFRKRMISENIVNLLRVGKLRTAVAFRYFENGELVNVKYRGLTEKKFHQEKNARPVLYGRDVVPDEAQELVITEGEIDCMSFYQYGVPAVVSIPSGASDTRWIEYNWEWLKRFKKIYLSYDMDSAGRSMVEKIAKRLGDYRVYDLQLPAKDANECAMIGITREEITDCLLSAKGYDRDNVKCATEYVGEVQDQILNPEANYGRPTGLRFLDDTLRGWRDAEVTVWTGKSASGKTTALMQTVAADIISEMEKGRSLPACVGSFEMRPEVLLKWGVSQARYLMHRSSGRSWVSEKMSAAEISGIINSVFRDVYIVDIKDRVSEDVVFDAFEFAARKYGCKVFVLDSLMRISLSPKLDKLDGQLAFMDRAAKFADTFGAHLHIVAHPRKSEKDSDRPDKVSVKGASEITDIAHNVISLYRYTEEQRNAVANKSGKELREIPNATLSLLKNREEGACGECKMMFDFENKFFREM